MVTCGKNYENNVQEDMARFLHISLSGVYGPYLRYPHPPLNQSSYTIFSFHRLAGYLPHPASYFFAALVGVSGDAAGLPADAVFGQITVPRTLSGAPGFSRSTHQW